jgi:hypothetical protein
MDAGQESVGYQRMGMTKGGRLAAARPAARMGIQSPNELNPAPGTRIPLTLPPEIIPRCGCMNSDFIYLVPVMSQRLGRADS